MWADDVRKHDTIRELSLDVNMVALQEADAVLLREDGLPDTVPNRLPAGYWVSIPGEERLAAALARAVADKAAAEARAEAPQQALAIRTAPPASRLGTGAVVAVGVLLIVAGGVAGYALTR